MSFIACDWGTSRLRVRWRGPDGLKEWASDDGASRLAALGCDRAQAFDGALRVALKRLGAPAGLPVLVSGMASSSIGWQELPYARLPFSLGGSGVVGRWLDLGDGARVCLISGVRDGHDMMRGEETQALGWAEQMEHAGDALPARATLVLPGTHSKHLRVESGALTGISTFMTGELFEVLRHHSVLRHSVASDATSPGADGSEPPRDSIAFAEGVRASAAPGLAAALFQVRSRQVLSGCDPVSNRSFLSGLLIGAELRSLQAGDGTLVLAAGRELREAYTRAATECGLSERWTAIEVDGLAELGQRRLWRRWASGHGLVASPDPDPCARP